MTNCAFVRRFGVGMDLAALGHDEWLPTIIAEGK
jgi:hypothetical protein